MTGNCNTGGAALDFSVVGGAAAPASPKENTIWVVTSTPISGWAIDRVYPDYPADGYVLITPRNSAAVKLRAVKNKDVYLYPAKFEQFNAAQSRWDGVGAYIYRNGDWESFDQYLFLAGTGESAVISVWNKQNGGSSGQYEPIGSVSVSETGIYLSAGNAQKSSAVSDQAAELSAFTQMTVTLSAKGGSGGSGARVVIVRNSADSWDPSTGDPSSTVAYKTLSVGDNVLDIANLTGSFYVRLLCWQSTNYNVTAIRLA